MRTRFDLAAALALFSAASAFAQAERDARDELSHWRYRSTPIVFEAGDAKNAFGRLLVPNEILGKAEPSLADLRLVGDEGRKIPFVLKTRYDVRTQQPVKVEHRFNAGRVGKSAAYEESYELAAAPLPGHNEIQIVTSDQGDPALEFRRPVQVWASPTSDFADAQALLPKTSYLVHFRADGRAVNVDRFHYPNSVHRYLRVRVEPDPYRAGDDPKIEQVSVFQAERSPGQYVTFLIPIIAVEGIRGQGGPGTAYTFRLGDDPTFCEKLTLTVDQDIAVDRPFQLWIAEEGSVRNLVRADWRWRNAAGKRVVDLSFPEIRAKTVRLEITDFENPPLKIVDATATAAARTMTFELNDVAVKPWRVYVGNPDADPARYDLADRVPARVDATNAQVAGIELNPVYVPPPVPFSERNPWAIHLVLAAGCLVLAWLLFQLARQTARGGTF